jgi:hypothetical protein
VLNVFRLSVQYALLHTGCSHRRYCGLWCNVSGNAFAERGICERQTCWHRTPAAQHKLCYTRRTMEGHVSGPRSLDSDAVRRRLATGRCGSTAPDRQRHCIDRDNCGPSRTFVNHLENGEATEHTMPPPPPGTHVACAQARNNVFKQSAPYYCPILTKTAIR